MTKSKTTKRALLASALALFVSVSMLIGSTFAWFTDTATVSGNIIKSGKLDVELEWADGSEGLDTANWKDASQGAIFDYSKWEPGYIQARHLKISNVGNLALKYQMQILANGVVSELADVIDVYFFNEAVQTTRASWTNANKIGTLAEVLNIGTTSSLTKTIQGNLYAEEGRNVKTITIAFKMQESAGNEYQNLSIGSDFTVRLYATQLTHENDSYGNTYDANATLPAQETPVAVVKALSAKQKENVEILDNPDVKLDTAYQFIPSETLEDIEDTEYASWHADYVVSADKKVPANSMMLAGYYKLFDDFMGLDGKWIGLSSDTDVDANTPIRLLADGLGVTINYTEICQFGNDGIGFLCGAADVTGQNAGTTLTVELRLYETEEPSVENGNSANIETGRSIVVGTFTYVFGGKYEADEQGAVYFYSDNGDVVLSDVENVTSANYTIPDNVTELDNGVFASNTDITTVTVPASVTEFGASGVTSTNASGGAFKGSNVTTIVLEEGLTEIPAAAFNGAKKLTSVSIPDSVTTIGVNAFRSTAITELTIPATVTNISYGAFRDMTSLTTVTFEGDHVDIPNYAFRGCTNLRKVYINANTATIGTNMAFCNASSNNPNTNNISFYVKNEEIANKIKASMGVGSYVAIYVNNTLYAEIK